MIGIAGKLVDLVADPERDRFFILRQDKNEVLVFDGSTYTQTSTLRTYNTPTAMAITFDRRWLLVGHENSHYVSVFDLETLEPARPIRLATGDYAQAIASSGKAILAMTRDGAGGDNQIHRLDLSSRSSTPLPTLGVFENKMALGTAMTSSPNGRYILIAQPDGTLTLYDSSADTFTVSRKETTPLLGAYAASNFDQFVVGNALLNSSLVPIKRFETETGKSSGFAFLDNQIGFRITAPTASAPGVLQRVDLQSGTGMRPTRTSEAPILGGTTTDAFTRSLAPLPSRNAIVALTTSGFTVFPWNFDVGSAPPRLDRIVNAADGTQPVAPGGLISLYGTDLSPVSQSSRQIPASDRSRRKLPDGKRTARSGYVRFAAPDQCAASLRCGRQHSTRAAHARRRKRLVQRYDPAGRAEHLPQQHCGTGNRNRRPSSETRTDWSSPRRIRFIAVTY